MKVTFVKNKKTFYFRQIVSLIAIFFIGLNPAMAETVTSSFPFNTVVSSTVQELPDATSTSSRELTLEPTIRIGISKIKNELKFTSDFPYEVFFGEDSKGMLPEGEVATLNYRKGVYGFSSGSLSATSTGFPRLVPADPGNFFTLPNFERKLKGRKNINFNAYRGTLEYRYSPKSKAVFFINELPLDEYVAGIAESSNDAAPEYLKALLVAARSYAYFFISQSAPTEKRMFDVYGSTVDQLYLGYNSELYMPNVVAAAADTAGEMVTYLGAPVITPYFSHSDGHTRVWKKSWGGPDRPWLKSVKAVYDKGKKLLGHGVGMSNHDAGQHALKDGWTYDQILGYYYASTTVERVY